MTAVALEATLARNGSLFPSVLSMHHWSAVAVRIRSSIPRRVLTRFEQILP